MVYLICPYTSVRVNWGIDKGIRHGTCPGSGVERMYLLEATESDSLLVAGNAGALLGYADILSDDGFVWLINSYTTASATISLCTSLVTVTAMSCKRHAIIHFSNTQDMMKP